MNPRKYIEPGTRLGFALSTRERDLIVERAFLDSGIETRLRAAARRGSRLVVDLTLDDVDDLHGCVAAEANHTNDGKVRRVLVAVCERLVTLEAEYTDERPAVAPPTRHRGAAFTQKQGQYLAFMYWSTKIHGRAPAEADLRQFFKVSAPTVHAMVVTLERRGLISRIPGKARSATLLISRAELPELE